MNKTKLNLAVRSALLHGLTSDGNPKPKTQSQGVGSFNLKAEGGILTIVIDGEISAIDHAALINQINESDLEEITVTLKSYGGDLETGVGIYSALKNHPALVTITINSYAMSAASIIAMAADHLVMHEWSVLMIHGASGQVSGNSQFIKEYAEGIDEANSLMATPYAEKSGVIPVEVFEALITDGRDHYFTGFECLAFGLADEIVEDDPVLLASGTEAERFCKPGRYITEKEIRESDLQASQTNSNSKTLEEENMKDLINRLRAALGLDALTDAELADEKNAEAMVAQLLAMKAKAEEVEANTDGEGDAEAQAKLQALTEDKADLAKQVLTLTAKVEAMETANQTNEIEGLVNAALEDGRATPAMKAGLVALGEASLDGLKDHLKALAPIPTSGGVAAGSNEAGNGADVLSDTELKMLKDAGVSKEAYLKAKGIEIPQAETEGGDQ